jgi:hypothetical protein
MSDFPTLAVRDQRQPGWFFVDNEVIDRFAGQIGAYGVAVYNVLCRHCRNSRQRVDNLSQRDIAMTLGISQDRARKSLSALVEVGLIAVEVPKSPGPQIISTYVLLTVKTTECHTFSSVAAQNATRSRNKEEETKTETEIKHPPTPLFEGRVSTIWQRVCEYLKDDLATAYANSPHFQEESYDKYFRDARLVEIRDGVAFVDSADRAVLREGIEKFQRRLREAFRGVVADIYAVRVIEAR